VRDCLVKKRLPTDAPDRRASSSANGGPDGEQMRLLKAPAEQGGRNMEMQVTTLEGKGGCYVQAFRRGFSVSSAQGNQSSSASNWQLAKRRPARTRLRGAATSGARQEMYKRRAGGGVRSHGSAGFFL